jgi:hypothetical protein
MACFGTDAARTTPKTTSGFIQGCSNQLTDTIGGLRDAGRNAGGRSACRAAEAFLQRSQPPLHLGKITHARTG